MRDITLLSKTPLLYEETRDIILSAFNDYEIIVDDPHADGFGRIWVAKEDSKIDISFTPDYRTEDKADEFEAEELSKLGFNAYFVTIIFRCGAAAVKLVQCLMQSGIELYVEDEDARIVTGQEFRPHPDAI